MYYLKNPNNEEKSEGCPENIDWEVAQKEIAQAKGFQTGFGAGLSKGSIMIMNAFIYIALQYPLLLK